MSLPGCTARTLRTTCARSATKNARQLQLANMRHWKMPVCNSFPKRHFLLSRHQDDCRANTLINQRCNKILEHRLPEFHGLGTTYTGGARQSRRVACSFAKWHMDASAAFPAFVQLNCGTWSGTFYVSAAVWRMLDEAQVPSSCLLEHIFEYVAERGRCQVTGAMLC